MKATVASVARSDTVPVRNPAVVYLESLHSSGYRGMLRALNCAVSIFTDGNVTDARQFDWSQMSTRHLETLCAVLADRDAARNRLVFAPRAVPALLRRRRGYHGTRNGGPGVLGPLPLNPQ